MQKQKGRLTGAGMITCSCLCAPWHGKNGMKVQDGETKQMRSLWKCVSLVVWDAVTVYQSSTNLSKNTIQKRKMSLCESGRKYILDLLIAACYCKTLGASAVL